MGTIRIMGQTFVAPKLRKSPGASKFNVCIGDKMRGKTYATVTARRNAFRVAAKACKPKRRKARR